jgi:hypothetical protein
MNGPDYIVDIAGIDAPQPQKNEAAGSLRGRPWLAVRWRCCGVYSRVYRNPQGTAYHGRCPNCGRAINLRVGEGGTSCRFFEAS